MDINFNSDLKTEALILALIDLKRGDRLLYHRGFLPSDRRRGDGDVDFVARLALVLARCRRINLHQELLQAPVGNKKVNVPDWSKGDGVWNYIAIGVKS